MYKRLLFLTICSMLLVLLSSDQANAQRRAPNYANAPTISPYTQLFRQNNGGVNNYFDFVRPQIQARQQFNRLQQNQYQNAQYQAQTVRQQTVNIQQAIEETLLQALPRQGTAARRSQAASFMNTNPYFPPFAIQAGGGRRAVR